MTMRTMRNIGRRAFAERQRAAILASLAPDQVRARVRELADAGRTEQDVAREVGWSVAMVRAALEPTNASRAR